MGSPPDELAVPGYPDNRVAPTPCPVRDARDAATSLDREGFVLAQHRSAFADERDKTILARDYHHEMAEFLKDYLGAAVVLLAMCWLGSLLAVLGAWLALPARWAVPLIALLLLIPVLFHGFGLQLRILLAGLMG